MKKILEKKKIKKFRNGVAPASCPPFGGVGCKARNADKAKKTPRKAK